MPLGNFIDNLKNKVSKTLGFGGNAPSPGNISNAVKNASVVKIAYSGNNHRRIRTIVPFAYGRNKHGNEVIRAFQYDGDTLRGVPKWKMFRTDKIDYWRETNKTADSAPYLFNYNGDLGLSQIYTISKFANGMQTIDNEPSEELQKETEPIITKSQENQQQTGNEAKPSLKNNTQNSEQEKNGLVRRLKDKISAIFNKDKKSDNVENGEAGEEPVIDNNENEENEEDNVI